MILFKRLAGPEQVAGKPDIFITGINSLICMQVDLARSKKAIAYRKTPGKGIEYLLPLRKSRKRKKATNYKIGKNPALHIGEYNKSAASVKDAALYFIAPAITAGQAYFI